MRGRVRGAAFGRLGFIGRGGFRLGDFLLQRLSNGFAGALLSSDDGALRALPQFTAGAGAGATEILSMVFPILC